MDPWPVTDARRFEGYVRWSLYVVLAVPAAPVLILVIGFVFGGAQDVPARLVVLLAALAVLAIAFAWECIVAGRWGLDRVMQGPARPRMWFLVVWSATAAAYVTIGFLLDTETAMSVLWLVFGGVIGAASAVLTARQVAVACFAGTLVVLAVGIPLSSRLVVAGVVWVWFLSWSAWSTAWMLRVLRALQRANETSAELALAEERLRISRDLHDVFGRTLAAIAVKSELASELSRRGKPDRAAAEMAEVRRLADSAGTEVRRVVRGELRATWVSEVDGARSLLRSAGIACTVAGDDVPDQVAGILGWVVRESVTNVLRHSDATQVTIAAADDDGSLVLTVSNDGASTPSTDRSGGSGLRSMAARLEAVGGTLDHHRDGDWFVLEARVPLHTPQHSEVPA